MTEIDSGRVHTVTSARQAQLLTEPKSKGFFEPFLAQERSVTQAAKELNCNLNTMLYRIKTLRAAKLLKVSRKEKRNGREIKHYRSVHDAYFIPFKLTPYATLEERLEAQGKPIFATLLNAYAQVLEQNERFGNYVFRGPTGGVITTDSVPDLALSGLPVVYSDMITNLSKEEALELAEELRNTFKRGFLSDDQAKRSKSQNQDYLMMVALLPLKP
jgi:hypothetical protein